MSKALETLIRNAALWLRLSAARDREDSRRTAAAEEKPTESAARDEGRGR
jgi:hypothetical protein